MAAIKFEHILAAAIGQKWLQSNLSTFWQLLGWNFTHRTKMAAIKFEHILAAAWWKFYAQDKNGCHQICAHFNQNIIILSNYCQIYLFIKFLVIAKFPSCILQRTSNLGFFVGARVTFELLLKANFVWPEFMTNLYHGLKHQRQLDIIHSILSIQHLPLS